MERQKTSTKQLTPRERAFSELVADSTDTRNVAQKALAAGYKLGHYGYQVLKKAHVIEEVERLVEMNLRPVRARRAQVLTVLADRACKKGKEHDHHAARLYLEHTSERGPKHITTVNVNQTTNNETEETIEDSCADIWRAREHALNGNGFSED